MLAVVLWAVLGPPAADAPPPQTDPPAADSSDSGASEQAPPELPEKTLPSPEFVRDSRTPRERSPKLHEVPFPLSDGGKDARDEQPATPQSGGNLTIADLRDPFSRRATRKRKGTQVSTLVIPDLRDPFRVRRVRRPKNWIPPQLPGDIRDPFSDDFRAEIRKRRTQRPCGGYQTTEDGVQIQRPDSMEPKQECATLTPPDLRDPFDNKARPKKP